MGKGDKKRKKRTRHKGLTATAPTPAQTTGDTDDRRRKTLSADALQQQLDNAQRELNELYPRLRAYQARLGIHKGTEHRPHRGDPQAPAQEVLERLAYALMLAELAGDPAGGTPLHDRTGHGSEFDRAIPGSSTRLARARARDLRDAVHTALDAFEWSAENDWQRKPREDQTVPKVRCRHRDCPAADVWVPAWRTYRGGKTVPTQFCSGCARPFSPDDLLEEAS